MKKCFSLLTAIALFVHLTLFCSAEVTLLRSTLPLPNIFLSAEQLSAFGNYDGMWGITAGGGRSYWITDDRAYSFIVDVGDISTYNISGMPMNVKCFEDMRTTNGVEELQHATSEDVMVHNCVYRYAEGNLYAIRLPLDQYLIEIRRDIIGDGGELYCYPQSGAKTILSRLLEPETAIEAIDELTARLEGTYEEPVNPWLIAAAIGGGVLLVVAVAVCSSVITVKVMRKKDERKKREEAATPAGTAFVPDAVEADGASPAKDAPPDSNSPPKGE